MSNRRAFLKQVAAAPAAAQIPAVQGVAAGGGAYPRVYRGRQLAMIAFPLGGVAAGSLSLGGRGQLRDWEIFNKPDKGNAPAFALPAIWVQAGNGKPVARVLESRILPPYEGPSGLGTKNAPGLSRMAAAAFTGEYPLAKVDFRDARVPVNVTLEAFSPFIPHEPDDSGLPAAILRYRVTNPGAAAATVSVAWSIDNVLGGGENEYREARGLRGIVMSKPALAAGDPMRGSFVVAALGGGDVTYLRGWAASRWRNAPMLFWDDFTADGKLGPEPEKLSKTASVCLRQTIAAGKSAEFCFLLAWHFPNRTPRWCGWHAPKGDENAVIGNWYATRWPDAWAVAEYAAANLGRLEKETRLFAAAMREATLPAAVKDAALSNASTLASTTCFRTADGEFHGFEGVNDKAGCCHGNCTHVWNYETTTAHLFPSFARSLRKAATGYSMDDAGAIHFRQSLPDGKDRSGFAAADGQMGQLLHAYLDFLQTGDREWLRGIWPRLRKAMEFCWVKGGWDGDRDGVMEGVQHNTYDVEFYGPNPQCGIYYLGGLRACEEMARAVGEDAFAAECRALFEKGSRWIDANLFNGEFYVQQVRGVKREEIAASLVSKMGSESSEQPEYQMGAGCLADQLIGQYLADVCGLGPLVKPENIRKTYASIWKYNHRASLATHDSVQRVYAINEEPGLLICDYAKAPRPRIPFPYFAEAWTGIEYLVAAAMIYVGMVQEGIQIYAEVRSRHDGEKRNPYDEPECGHHYARAMAAWSGVLALCGFRYDGRTLRVEAAPRTAARPFRGFWANGTGWGTFLLTPAALKLKVLHGELRSRSVAAPLAAKASAALNGHAFHAETARAGALTEFRFAETVLLRAGDELVLG